MPPSPDFRPLQAGAGAQLRVGDRSGGDPGLVPARPLLEPPAGRRGQRLLAWLFERSGWLVLRPLLDLTALLVALLLTLNWPGEPLSLAQAPVLLAFPPLVLAILAARGTYRQKMSASVLDDALRGAAGVSMGAMVVVVVQVYVAGTQLQHGVLVHAWALSMTGVAAAAWLALTLQRRTRVAGMSGRRTVVVGAGAVGERVARRLLDSPEYGLVPIGFLDSQPPASLPRSLPVLGGPADLDWIAQLSDVRHVVLAFSASADSEFVPVVRRCEQLGLGISVVPRLFDTLNARASYETIGGLPLLGLDMTDPRGTPFVVKHVLDRVLAGLALAVLAPLLGAIALAVRVGSPGPVLFRQRRVGRDGRPFDLLKFRSMAASPVGGAGFEPAAGAAPGGVEGEDRRTMIGRLLRRTSLDELPQLINVVRGEMSLVGPRPERPEYVERFRRDIERYGERHRVKAGITGWAQVNGLRGQTSIADRAEWDNFYIEHWSLWLDVKILLLTCVAIFRHAE